MEKLFRYIQKPRDASHSGNYLFLPGTIVVTSIVKNNKTIYNISLLHQSDFQVRETIDVLKDGIKTAHFLYGEKKNFIGHQ